LKGPVQTLGTIDGKLNVPSAGLVGLHPPGIKSDKIHNIKWSPRYERFGWTGAHTDATSLPMVRLVLSQHIMPHSPPHATASNDPLQPLKRVARQIALSLDLDQNLTMRVKFWPNMPGLKDNNAKDIPPSPSKDRPANKEKSSPQIRHISLH